MIKGTPRERVKKGCEVLDQKLPGWSRYLENPIDVKTDENEVLFQVFGKPMVDVIEEWGVVNGWMKWVVEHGFLPNPILPEDEYEAESKDLNTAWAKAVRERYGYFSHSITYNRPNEMPFKDLAHKFDIAVNFDDKLYEEGEDPWYAYYFSTDRPIKDHVQDHFIQKESVINWEFNEWMPTED